LIHYTKTLKGAGQTQGGANAPPRPPPERNPEDVIFCALFINASGFGRPLMLISYLGSIIKGCVPHTPSLQLVLINGGGQHASMCSFNQDQVANRPYMILSL